MKPLDGGGEPSPSLDTQRSFWNAWNARTRKRSELPTDARSRGEAVLRLVRSLRLQRPRILEVGCSTGWLCASLSGLGEVTGTDLADDVIAEARVSVPGVRFVAGDFLTLDLGEEPFDVVVTLETIAHVRDRKAFLDRIRALLKEGGHLVITTQNRYVWERSGVLSEPPEILQRLLTMPELKRFLRPGFEVLEATTILPFGHGGILRLVNSFKLNPPLEALFGEPRVRRFKERLGLGNTLVVLARRRP